MGEKSEMREKTGGRDIYTRKPVHEETQREGAQANVGNTYACVRGKAIAMMRQTKSPC
jgi:hypothetical protein